MSLERLESQKNYIKNGQKNVSRKPRNYHKNGHQNAWDKMCPKIAAK